MLEKSKAFKKIDVINMLGRSNEIMAGNIVKNSEIDIDSIDKALSGILYIINEIKETAEDGFQVSDLFDYGSLVPKIISVAKEIPEAMIEKQDLNEQEIEILVGKFTEEGLKLIGVGSGEDNLGTEAIESCLSNLADIIIIAKHQLSNGLGVDDIPALIPITTKAVIIITKAGDMADELNDATAAELAQLLAMLAVKILYVIKG